MRNMLLTVSDVSHRWQPDLKGNEGKENALTSGNLPRPSAGTYNKAVLQMAVLEQRNRELTEEVTLLHRRNYELMDQNTYALEKVKRQKRVMKTQKRTIETLQIEREERPTADVRAPCTAALHRYARHAGRGIAVAAGAATVGRAGGGRGDARVAGFDHSTAKPPWTVWQAAMG